MVHSLSLFLLAVFIKPPRLIIMDHWKESFWKISPACFKPPNLLPFLLGGLLQYPKLPSLKAPFILTTKHQAVLKYIVLRLFLDIWNRHAIVSIWLLLGPSRHHRIIRNRLHLSGHVGCMLPFFVGPYAWVKPMVSLRWKEPDSKAQRGYTVTPFTSGRVPSCITVTLMADKMLLSQESTKKHVQKLIRTSFVI